MLAMAISARGRGTDTLLVRFRMNTPLVLVAHIAGENYQDAAFRELLYAINVDTRPHTLTLEALRDRPFALHPVHQQSTLPDSR